MDINNDNFDAGIAFLEAVRVACISLDDGTPPTN